jgi:small redox-active disulfide protein 2
MGPGASRTDKERCMKKIAVYGPGCMKCKKSEENVRQALAETGVEATVEHVTEMQAIVAAGVMSTPAVAIDGVIKLSGRVPTTAELRQWIAGKA